MKNFDAKKLLVFILIIAVVALIGFGVLKLIQGVSKPSEKEQTASETLAVNYYLNLTSGYNTLFNGQDLLYSKDKWTVDDISLESKYSICIKYAMDHELDLFPDSTVKGMLGLGKRDDVIIYNSDAINEASKILFGEDMKFGDTVNEDFKNNYTYVQSHKVVVAEINKRENAIESNNSMDYKIIGSKKEGKNIVTTVAIAYVANLEDGTYTYAATPDLEKVVVTGIGEYKIPEDKIGEFPQYKITMSKVNDSYVFKSIEKTDK